MVILLVKSNDSALIKALKGVTPPRQVEFSGMSICGPT